MLTMLDSACEFIDMNCRVGVVGGKDPSLLGANWQHQWTRDIDLVTRWFSCWPRADLGILPDTACCPLDIDDPESFDRFQAETTPAPDTPCYLTGGTDPPGRKRLLFQYDPRLERAERKLANGVQLRFCTADSAMMSTVPPSIHPVSGLTL